MHDSSPASRPILLPAALAIAFADALFLQIAYSFAFAGPIDRMLAIIASVALTASLLTLVGWSGGAVMARAAVALGARDRAASYAGLIEPAAVVILVIGATVYLLNSFVFRFERLPLTALDLGLVGGSIAIAFVVLRSVDRRGWGAGNGRFPWRQASALAALGLLAWWSAGWQERPGGRNEAAEVSETRSLGGPELKGANLLLVVIDTLRADRLSSGGYPRETTPEIDRWLGSGVRFVNARASATRTSPAMASMLTGQSPLDHGVVESRSPLLDSLPTLAERLREHGYWTAAVLGNSNVGNVFGFTRGFDSVDEAFRRHDHGARGIVERGIAEIEARPDRPFFLYLHLIDPHTPYAPPLPWATKFLGDDLYRSETAMRFPPGFVFGERRESSLDDRGRSLADYVAAYDGEVAFADHQIGRLLRHLDANGLLDQTLVVLTSDHGEAMGEHGLWFTHGPDSYDECARVPLILAHPALSAKVDRRPVSHIDVVQTIARRLVDDGARLGGGFDLISEWDDAESSARAVLAVAGDPWRRILAITDGEWKLVLEPRPWRDAARFARLRLATWRGPHGDSPYRQRALRRRLFHLSEDPREQNNLAGRGLEAESRLLGWVLARIDSSRQRIVDPLPADRFDEGVERQLRSLGYL